MSPRTGQAGPEPAQARTDTPTAPLPTPTLAFVESPVQLLNVLEWAHQHAPDGAHDDGAGDGARDDGEGAGPERAPAGAPVGGALHRARGLGSGITVVVLSPTDPMTRGQLRRMTELARDEGHHIRWEEARGASTAPLATVRGLAPLLRAARRIVIGDPFSRYVQLLLTITRARDLVVVDDGTATMEFVTQLARGERLVRWHRRGGRRGPRDMVFAPVSASARRRLTPGHGRTVEVFSSMPIEDVPDGVHLTSNDFGWTRARFGPPRVADGADLVGTSLVETGVVDLERYLAAVSALAREHGAVRYFAHRREDTDKLHRLSTETGLQILRPDLPLELIARRGPIGSTIVSFPSTVVHTLPLALTGTGVKVAVCDIDPAWLTAHASPRAEGFLAGVTGTARGVQRLGQRASVPGQESRKGAPVPAASEGGPGREGRPEREVIPGQESPQKRRDRLTPPRV
ncbi:hypothetical protein [Streptomyces sp. TS71-3]|uniref:hypothetical protein n=1 Tax=Streptomyces sp. TS71-3 TaxID=2733862 RepID=UPI001B0343CC|nr:hypothetical protein [Streptomyces sp. TS71-3]GHJ35203.1 hypothetical protein Sm713_08120 [Streptomyces sp. TS71-3]